MDKKNNRKKLLSGVLAAAMLTGLLSGCGVPGQFMDPSPEPVVSSGVEPTHGVTGTGETTASPQPSGQADPETSDPVSHPSASISPQVTPEPTPQVSAWPEPTSSPAPTPAVTQIPVSTPKPVQSSSPTLPPEGIADSVPVKDLDLSQEADALSQGAAAIPNPTVTPSGEEVKETSEAEIDYSNASDGYVMVRYNHQTTQRLKAQVKGPTTTYTYNLTVGQWAAFPLSDGNGDYRITVYKNVTDSKYAAVLSVSATVALKNEFAPFLHSNQYVNYAAAPNTVYKASQLTGGISDPLKKVEAVYDFVVKEISYDKALASSVSSGYLPNLDRVLAKKSGICFDYAAMMTGMLRSQGVPCKLVVGYAGSAYHAWISVWSQNTGWVDGVIFFNGSSWQRMDPTFASSNDNSESILQYIGNASNYSAKYFY